MVAGVVMMMVVHSVHEVAKYAEILPNGQGAIIFRRPQSPPAREDVVVHPAELHAADAREQAHRHDQDDHS
jgi:uncharacterized membrane protein